MLRELTGGGFQKRLIAGKNGIGAEIKPQKKKIQNPPEKGNPVGDRGS